jgi:hypothetical protein
MRARFAMGKKSKQANESVARREMAIEAEFFARRLGLTKAEALKTMKDASSVRPLAAEEARKKSRSAFSNGDDGRADSRADFC